MAGVDDAKKMNNNDILFILNCRFLFIGKCMNRIFRECKIFSVSLVGFVMITLFTAQSAIAMEPSKKRKRRDDTISAEPTKIPRAETAVKESEEEEEQETASSLAPTPPNAAEPGITKLNVELVDFILSFLSRKDLLSTSRTSKFLFSAAERTFKKSYSEPVWFDGPTGGRSLVFEEPPISESLHTYYLRKAIKIFLEMTDHDEYYLTSLPHVTMTFEQIARNEKARRKLMAIQSYVAKNSIAYAFVDAARMYLSGYPKPLKRFFKHNLSTLTMEADKGNAAACDFLASCHLSGITNPDLEKSTYYATAAFKAAPVNQRRHLESPKHSYFALKHLVTTEPLNHYVRLFEHPLSTIEDKMLAVQISAGSNQSLFEAPKFLSQILASEQFAELDEPTQIKYLRQAVKVYDAARFHDAVKDIAQRIVDNYSSYELLDLFNAAKLNAATGNFVKAAHYVDRFLQDPRFAHELNPKARQAYKRTASGYHYRAQHPERTLQLNESVVEDYVGCELVDIRNVAYAYSRYANFVDSGNVEKYYSRAAHYMARALADGRAKYEPTETKLKDQRFLRMAYLNARSYERAREVSQEILEGPDFQIDDLWQGALIHEAMAAHAQTDELAKAVALMKKLRADGRYAGLSSRAQIEFKWHLALLYWLTGNFVECLQLNKELSDAVSPDLIDLHWTIHVYINHFSTDSEAIRYVDKFFLHPDLSSLENTKRIDALLGAAEIFAHAQQPERAKQMVEEALWRSNYDLHCMRKALLVYKLCGGDSARTDTLLKAILANNDHGISDKRYVVLSKDAKVDKLSLWQEILHMPTHNILDKLFAATCFHTHGLIDLENQQRDEIFLHIMESQLHQHHDLQDLRIEALHRYKSDDFETAAAIYDEILAHPDHTNSDQRAALVCWLKIGDMGKTKPLQESLTRGRNLLMAGLPNLAEYFASAQQIGGQKLLLLKEVLMDFYFDKLLTINRQ